MLACNPSRIVGFNVVSVSFGVSHYGFMGVNELMRLMRLVGLMVRVRSRVFPKPCAMGFAIHRFCVWGSILEKCCRRVMALVSFASKGR